MKCICKCGIILILAMVVGIMLLGCDSESNENSGSDTGMAGA